MGRYGGVEGQFVTHSEEETIALGQSLGKVAKENDIYCFFGDLGAGKTTLIKGIIEATALFNRCDVFSPTFLYLNPYISQRGLSVYHFDLYRLKSVEEFLALGFEEYFFASGLTCIEWSEKIASILPEEKKIIEIKMSGPTERTIVIR